MWDPGLFDSLLTVAHLKVLVKVLGHRGPQFFRLLVPDTIKGMVWSQVP